jgi:hypothetical protein
MQPDPVLGQLEEIVKLSKLAKNSKYTAVIKALTGFEVLPFDLSSEKNNQLLESLSKAASEACEKAHTETIVTARPNEAGNMIEPFLVDALKLSGLEAGNPRCRSGALKSSGYPDIEIKGLETRVYIDCKTYAASNQYSTLRSFYLSPSKDPKITSDAYHFLISFELKEIGIKNQKKVFVPVSWKIYSLDDTLDIKLKCEFNASNKDLYSNSEPLKEGKISKPSINF